MYNKEALFLHRFYLHSFHHLMHYRFGSIKLQHECSLVVLLLVFRASFYLCVVAFFCEIDLSLLVPLYIYNIYILYIYIYIIYIYIYIYLAKNKHRNTERRKKIKVNHWQNSNEVTE